MKKNIINRREFVGKLVATAALLEPAAQAVSQPQASAMKPGMKVGLYSITYLGIWYRGEGLSMEDVIKRARKHGYDGVEFDGKRPHANPLDLSTSRCRELRRMADGEGIELFGVAANNDFSSPIPEHREAQICYVRHLVNCASEMNAKLVRVFFAWPGITQHPQVADYDLAKRIWAYTHKPFTMDAAWAWCREGLTESARYAADAGVTLALQNHKPMMNDHNDVLRMIREVNSPALKMSFDPWGLPIKTPEYILKAAREVGSMQVLCHLGGVYERGADGKVKGETHFRPFVAAMKDIGYQGYLSYEMCSEPPKVGGKIEGLERADRNAQLAAEFLRGLIKEA